MFTFFVELLCRCTLACDESSNLVFFGLTSCVIVFFLTGFIDQGTPWRETWPQQLGQFDVTRHIHIIFGCYSTHSYQLDEIFGSLFGSCFGCYPTYSYQLDDIFGSQAFLQVGGKMAGLPALATSSLYPQVLGFKLHPSQLQIC